MQFSRLLDAALFAVSFWLAHLLRADNATLAKLGGPLHIQPFWEYAWLLLVIIPGQPVAAGDARLLQPTPDRLATPDGLAAGPVLRPDRPGR